MKAILKIVLSITLFSLVTGRLIKAESEHAVEKHSRFRREESQFMTTIEKLVNHQDYTEFLIGAKTAEKEALKLGDKAGLNHDQRKAVFLYTLENKFVYALNDKLKEGNGAGEFTDYVNLLMSALWKIGSSRPQGGIAWRIVHGQMNHSPGEPVIWPAFSSTAADRDSVPKKENPSTLYEIEGAIGYCIESYSDYPGEKEYLMPPNTKLEVIDGPRQVFPFIDRWEYTLRLVRFPSSTAVSLSMTVSWGTSVIAVIVSCISIFDELLL